VRLKAAVGSHPLVRLVLVGNLFASRGGSSGQCGVAALDGVVWLAEMGARAAAPRSLCNLGCCCGREGDTATGPRCSHLWPSALGMEPSSALVGLVARVVLCDDVRSTVG
jgi:hypothetical protein